MTQEEARVFFEFWVGQVIAPGFFGITISIIVASVITNYLRLFADENKELDKNIDPNKELSENFKLFREKNGYKISEYEKLLILCAISTLAFGGSLMITMFETGVSIFKQSYRFTIIISLGFLILLILLFALFNLAKNRRIKEGIIKDNKNTGLLPIIIVSVILISVFLGMVMSLIFA